MTLRIRDRYLWDFWLVSDQDDHHIFYLQSPRSLDSPDDRHWHVSIGHAVSQDLADWAVLPDALGPASEGAWDDYTTWTGSVVRHDGSWWMAYTGTSRAESGLRQRIGMVRSDDLTTWERVGTGPVCELDPQWYEELDTSVWHDQAWRDPWLFRHESQWHMLVTARVRQGHPRGRGVIGHATSDDLLSWTTGPPLTTPGVFGHMEIPQLEQIEGRWYLCFSVPGRFSLVAEDRFAPSGTHFMVADDPFGPYRWEHHGLLLGDGGDEWYGARLHRHGGEWKGLAWENARGSEFVGAVSDPMPIEVSPGGIRMATPPPVPEPS